MLAMKLTFILNWKIFFFMETKESFKSLALISYLMKFIQLDMNKIVSFSPISHG